MPRQIYKNKAEADDLTFATLTTKIYIPNRRSELVSWDWIDKNLIKKEKLFWEESITILPLHLHFHLVVILPDSAERLQRQLRLFCQNMTREIVLVPWLFCDITTPTGMHYRTEKNRNFFQGFVTENIKDPGTTTTLKMGIPCRQQNWRGYQHIYVQCDFFASKNLSLALSCL